MSAGPDKSWDLSFTFFGYQKISVKLAVKLTVKNSSVPPTPHLPA